MARCEDFPACGHENGCCPDYDESGRQLNMVCVCGKKLPITSRYSCCDACMRDPDDPNQFDDRDMGDEEDIDGDWESRDRDDEPDVDETNYDMYAGSDQFDRDDVDDFDGDFGGSSWEND